jgi:RNA polymerase sigma-70 factor (ECF subfamily)
MERDARNLRVIDTAPDEDDPWEAELDGFAARDTLERLGAHHRAALTLRYVDDLPVPEVAALLDRTVHATEALLARARRAFREIYESLHPDGNEEVLR